MRNPLIKNATLLHYAFLQRYRMHYIFSSIYISSLNHHVHVFPIASAHHKNLDQLEFRAGIELITSSTNLVMPYRIKARIVGNTDNA